MQHPYYTAGFFVLLGCIAFAEYIISPPEVYEGESSFYTDSNTEKKGLDSEIKKILQKNILDTVFQDSGISVTRVEPSSEVNHIFHLFPFSAEKNDFRVFSTTYLQNNKEGKNEKYVVVYDIFSTKTRTTGEAYSDIKNIVQKELEGDIEKQVLEHNKYGQKSFSLKNLEQQGKVMYLVVAYQDRLLGIEYSFSRYDEMGKVFTRLFQSQ